MPNKIFLQRYQVLHSLNQSADAQTYHVLDTQSQQERVMKRLQLGKINSWKRLELFEREARVLAALNHPRIPRLLDFYREETEQGLNLYLISTWIQGESLAQKIKQHWLPEEPILLRWAEQLLSILEYLHAFQPPVIHRDIKPSNLIIHPEGQLYLIDFGGAQELLRPSGGGGSTVIGTFGYMSPEQFAGRAIPATDLYGMGTSLIHLLSGRAPVNIPQRNMQLNFQGLVQGSGGLLRWLTQMIRPATEDRFSSAYIARQQLYAMTDLRPSEETVKPEQAPAMSESLHLLLARSQTEGLHAEPEQSLRVGDLIEGYQISRHLSQGSHSVSYLALTPDHQHEVFLKSLHFQSQQTWKGLTLFEREIKVLQRLSHAGIPKYIHTFKTPEQDFYLVTEKIEGQNLEQKLRTGWRPLESEVIELALQALDILQYLHEQKPVIVHRDLKPSNFLIDLAGRLYLIDFGSVQDHFQIQGTGGSTVIGTYGYIAPEEFLKKAVPATDLYSLGMTLVRLLSGYEPTALPQQALRLSFRPLLNCSEALKDWLETMTEPDLQHRFRSAAQAKSILAANAQVQAATLAYRANHQQVKPRVKTNTRDIQLKDHYYSTLDLKGECLALDIPQTRKQDQLGDFKNLVARQIKSSPKNWEISTEADKHTLRVRPSPYTDAENKALLLFLAKFNLAPTGFKFGLKWRAIFASHSLKKSVSTMISMVGLLILLSLFSALMSVINGNQMQNQSDFFLVFAIFFVLSGIFIAYNHKNRQIKEVQARWHHQISLEFRTATYSKVSINTGYRSISLIDQNQEAEFECQKIWLDTKAVYLLIIKQKIKNSLKIKNDLLPCESIKEAQAIAQLLQMAQLHIHPQLS